MSMTAAAVVAVFMVWILPDFAQSDWHLFTFMIVLAIYFGIGVIGQKLEKR